MLSVYSRRSEVQRAKDRGLVARVPAALAIGMRYRWNEGRGLSTVILLLLVEPLANLIEKRVRRKISGYSFFLFSSHSSLNCRSNDLYSEQSAADYRDPSDCSRFHFASTPICFREKAARRDIPRNCILLPRSIFSKYQNSTWFGFIIICLPSSLLTRWNDLNFKSYIVSMGDNEGYRSETWSTCNYWKFRHVRSRSVAIAIRHEAHCCNFARVHLSLDIFH